ncbi:hypothetical protein BGZ95_007951 [Linnemannia exigua]|uniref:G-protein coupled receptors family 2 profile 2 domain-containing protein n=1 Tax=Linnemannia exigua TaxID=604196 RepID=A0AAD4HBU4_9FUNG|nr:hypothetical protein BGZ95_007951 [Linnemannia exigua]
MLIILFTAFSNLGFAIANIITEYTNASTKLQCTVSAWCYVFFQLLTCTLVIISTFRLCGVFLFQRRRSIPSKYITICPIVAFLLATLPAITGNFDFDECGHYCWFKLLPDQQDCKVRTPWAWLSFYGWMFFFIAILFASTLFVMVKIVLSVTHSRADLKQVVNQSTLEAIMADSPPLQSSSSTFQRLRSMSYTVQARTASIFSFGGRRRGTAGTTGSTGNTSGGAVAGDGAGAEDGAGTGAGAGSRFTGTGALPGNGSATVRQQQQPTINFHPNLEGVVLPSPTELAALASPPPLTDLSLQVPLTDRLEHRGSRSRSTSPNVPRTTLPGQEGSLGQKERSFVVAILRQALYPISISVSGCVQIFVDLTIPTVWDQDNELGYAANVATSIQGLLFFLVFFFDPAVVQTRREWRKYMVWRYYIEFYYSLEMPHEGREFETRFMKQCQELDPGKNQAKFDQLTRPPSYSWSLQYDSLAMPTDFQTTYPLSAAINSTPPSAAATDGVEQNDGAGTRQGEAPDPSVSGKHVTQTILPAQIAEVDETEFTNPTTLTRPTPAITIVEPTTVSSDSLVATMADYTRTTSDPSSETSAATATSRAATTSTTTTSATTLTTTTSATTPTANTAAGPSNANTWIPPKDEEIRIHPMSQITTLEAFHNSYQSTPSISTFRDLDIPQQHDRVYLDKDMDTDRNARRTFREREPTLKAPYAGDILNFPRLSKVRTIGGGIGNGRSPRRYRNSTNLMGSSGTFTDTTSTTFSRPSAATSRGAGRGGRRGVGNEKRRSFGESLLLFLQGGHWNSATAEENYQTRFRYPRLAYLIHRIVRVIYIPKKARLPPIPDPFARKPHGGGGGVGDMYERPITRESMPPPPCSSSAMMTGVMVQQSSDTPCAPCQDIDNPRNELAGLGLDYSGPSNSGGRCEEYEDYGDDEEDDPQLASYTTIQQTMEYRCHQNRDTNEACDAAAAAAGATAVHAALLLPFEKNLYQSQWRLSMAQSPIGSISTAAHFFRYSATAATATAATPTTTGDAKVSLVDNRE